MPFFSVLLEGTGLGCSSSNEELPVAGFFTTRVVWARSRDEAERRATEEVVQEWSVEPYVSHPGAKSLSLAVSECDEVGFMRGLVNRPSGFTFFAAEE